jgi:uncharacterized protein (DUF2062 family)
MPKRIIKRFMPDHEKIRQQKCLACLGKALHDRSLWHLNRHSIAGAFFVGLVAAFIPVPFQMLIAATMAVMLHVNIPLSVALVWLTNPLTMPPIFYFAYRVGVWALQQPPQEFHFELSTHWLLHHLSHSWQPFLLGCLICGLLSGTLGYLFIRFGWRAYVVVKWRRRHAQPVMPRRVL